MGTLLIRHLDVSDNNDPGIITSSHSYRYVLIPGSVLGGTIVTGPAQGYSVDQLRAMPYQQIETMFKISANGTNVNSVKWANQE